MAVTNAGTSRKQPQTVPRDVFVSYTRKDESVARAVVDGLEAHGLTCFAMYRDIPRGTANDWTEVVAPALDKAGVMVLVQSKKLRYSTNVPKELRYAERRKPKLSIVKLRIDNYSLPPALRLEIGGDPLDASPDPLHPPIGELAAAVRIALAPPRAKQRIIRPKTPPRKKDQHKAEGTQTAVTAPAWSQCLIGEVPWRFRVGLRGFVSLESLTAADDHLRPSSHDDPSQSLALSPDGTWAATLSGDGRLCISTINRITGVAARWREIQVDNATSPDGTCRLLAAAGRGIGKGVACIVSTPEETIEVAYPSPLDTADDKQLARVPSLAAAYVACRHLLIDADGQPGSEVLAELLGPHRVSRVLALDAGQIGLAHTYLAILGKAANKKPVLLTADLEGPAGKIVASEVCHLATPADHVVVVRSKRAQQPESVCVLTAEGSAVETHFPFGSCRSSATCRDSGA